MDWEPKKAIVSCRAIPDNLLDFVTDEERQAAALTWAGGENFKLLKKLTNTIAERNNPVYPNIGYLDDNDAKDYTEDVIPAVYTGKFEISVQSNSPDTALSKARIYQTAIESMILNCPLETVLENTGAFDAVLNTVEVGFEPMKVHTDRKNDFLQDFQIRFTYSLWAGTQEA